MPTKYVWAWKCNQMISAWLSVDERETGHAVILCMNPKNPHGNVGYWQLLFDIERKPVRNLTSCITRPARLRSKILNPDPDVQRDKPDPPEEKRP